jgi:cobalt-zinc-cadmium efflux system membrane fusion protein
MAAPLTVPKPDHAPPARKSRAGVWALAAVVALGAVAGAAYQLGLVTASEIAALVALGRGNAEAAAPDPTPPPKPTGPWDGLVRVKPAEQKAIGFNFATVTAQTDPVRLELTGRTAYDDNTINKVRPRFDTRVENVFATIGQKVSKGDPLVELYSTDLATSKSDYQTKWVQWQHDHNLYVLRDKLQATGAISQQLWVDTQNDEQKSRLDLKLAQDKLEVFYEVPKEEIEPLLEHLRDRPADPTKFGSVADKAKMTLRAKSDGYVISRYVVKGNYYESTDVLLEIAPLDHLWVWVNVFELDQDKVRVGQTMDIQFPYLAKTIPGRVDYVAPEVSKDTRAVKIRAVISNPDARLKADMLVKAMLEIPPIPGQTIIPRLAMVAISGREYVFVRVPSDHGKGKAADDDDGTKPGSRGVERFRRVEIRIAQENSDTVVVASGLTPGEEVVTNGSLILAQLYEDQRMTTTGLPTP